MTNTVAPAPWVMVFTASCTFASVSKSTLAKASSMQISLLPCSRALERLSSCRSPVLKFEPCSAIWKPKPRPSAICTARRASQTCLSVCSSNGSRLYLRLPEKKLGSWGTQEMHLLSLLRGILAMSTPSMVIAPFVVSASLARAMKMELLPLPVLPQKPTFTPPGQAKSTPFNTMGRSSLYRIHSPETATAPASGKEAGG
mmetsp:Transcript_22094/g.69819  ORF Transcript_22094/g.69819 Transcript_22094/m.69819 type:complete len:200 (+) Transcript_22094:236-835(+)